MNTVIYSRLRTDFGAQRWDNTIRVQQRHWSRFLLRNGEQKSDDLGFGCLPQSPEQRQQGDGELWSDRRAHPYWPYREETSPVSTGPPPGSDHCREPVRHSARDKGHEEGGSAYAKAGSSLRSPPGYSRAFSPQKPESAYFIALCSHLWLYWGLSPTNISLSLSKS